jgi:hypothetical protein
LWYSRRVGLSASESFPGGVSVLKSNEVSISMRRQYTVENERPRTLHHTFCFAQNADASMTHLCVRRVQQGF